MAWNTPGGSGKDGRNPRRRGPLDPLLEPLRGIFGGGAGGSPHLMRWAGVIVGLWLVFNCFVLVTEQQRAVILRFGQFARVLQPGPHFKWPWPVESALKLNATQIKTFSDTVPVLTRDENIVSVEVNVQYRVDDPQLYLFGSRDADQVLQQAALSTVREMVGRSDLDTVLSARSAISVAAKQRLQASLKDYHTGLVVTELNLPNARPPEEVKDAFDDANRAQQDKDRLKNEAEAYASKVVPEARGQAARTRTVAEGYKTAKIAAATGDAERFTLLLDQYKQAPEVTRKRLWLETVQQVLSENRKVVGGNDHQLIYVPMPSSSSATSSTSMQTPSILPPELVAPTVTATGDDTRPARDERNDDREVSR